MYWSANAVPVTNSTFMDAEICFYESVDSADAWLRIPYTFDTADRAITDADIIANVTNATGNVAGIYTRLLTLRAALAAMQTAGRQQHGSLWRTVTYSDAPEIAGGLVTQAWYVTDADAEPWFSETTPVSVVDPQQTADRALAAIDARSLQISGVFDRLHAITGALGITVGTRYPIGGGA